MKKTLITSAILAAVIGAVGVAAISPVMANKAQGRMSGMEQRFDFEAMDADNDGKITREELEAHRSAEFDARDTDNDGFLSPEEMSAAILAKMNERMSRKVAKMVERHDSDGDGRLSKEEMSQSKHRGGDFFDRLDEDGDGAISAEEMEEHKERHADRGKGWGHKKRFEQDQD